MSDGIAKGTTVPVSKLPGHDQNLEARAGAVQRLQRAVDDLYHLASGKKGADELHAQINKHIADLANFRV